MINVINILSCGVELTGTTQALLSQSNQHIQTQVAICRFTKVLQSPHMLPIILYILQDKENEKDKDNGERIGIRLDNDNATVMKNITAFTIPF